MMTSNYRPQIGDTLFVSFNNEQPFLTTVKGYHHDDRFSSEQFEYIRKNGRTDSTSLSHATFYPDMPIDTAFIYVVVLEEHEFMERSDSIELGYFFDPQDAFNYIEAVLSGEVKPRFEAMAEFSSYSVQVVKA